MRLFLTKDDFIWKSVTRPNIPFLCDSEMELVAAPNEYLRFIATVRGRTRSEKTWVTYGHHLYEFFAFLEANNLAWDAVNQTQIAAWRDSMLERKCARSTVNQRLRCVHGFYGWSAFYRLRVCPQYPEKPQEYDSPPIALAGNYLFR